MVDIIKRIMCFPQFSPNKLINEDSILRVTLFSVCDNQTTIRMYPRNSVKSEIKVIYNEAPSTRINDTIYLVI